MKIRKVICAMCGNEFETVAHNVKFCDSCRPVAKKNYRLSHHKENFRKYYLKHRAEIIARNLRNYIENREKINAKRRKRYYQKCIEYWRNQNDLQTLLH